MRKFFATRFDTLCTVAGAFFILCIFGLAMRFLGPDEFTKNLNQLPLASLLVPAVLSGALLLYLGHLRKVR